MSRLGMFRKVRWTGLEIGAVPKKRAGLQTRPGIQRKFVTLSDGRPPLERTNKGGDNQEDQEHEEQNLRDFRGSASDAGEAKQARDDGDDQEYQCPSKHMMWRVEVEGT
jgi:hypothetical protein